MPLSTFQHLAVCLPARDEAENLRVLLPELDRSLADLGLNRVTVYVFDDGSRDGTAEIVGSTELTNGELILIQSMSPVGKASALGSCMNAALGSGADSIVMMDADGQDDPVFLRAILSGLESGLDVVNGRRTNRAHPYHKRLSSRAFNAAARLVSRRKIWDINSGFKGFSRRGAENLAPYLYGELHRVLIVIAVWLGLPVGETLVSNRARSSGQTKYGFARGWRGLFDLVAAKLVLRYHNRPGHFFGAVGVSLVGLATVIGGMGFLLPLGGALQSGYVMGAIGLAGFGLVLASFGFLAELMLFLSKTPPTKVVTVTRVSAPTARS
jgi:glycosyltransferase involved in cell wall biosynthesis